MNKRVKFLEAFKDGNIFPRSIGHGEILVLTEIQTEQVKRSGGYVEVLETTAAPLTSEVESKKSEKLGEATQKAEAEKEEKRKEAVAEVGKADKARERASNGKA